MRAMALDEQVLRERLEAVFARQDTLEACKRRDLGALIRILGMHGITQGQIGSLTGFAQSSLSNYKRGKHDALHASTYEKFADGLSLPPHLRQALGVGADTSSDGPGVTVEAGGIPADPYELQLLAEVIGRNGSSVKRREMLSLVAQIGAAAALAQSEVWERLAYALTSPSAMNEGIIREMENRTAGFHRLEETVSAPTLLKGLTVHLREVGTLLNGTASDPKNELRKRLIVVAGESSVLAGWAASDIGDTATARNYYDTAVKAAKQCGDPAITACALAYRSYIPSTKGANGRSRVLLTEALENVSESGSPATMAWIAARHAEESAHLGDKSQALASWGRAEEAYNLSDPDEDRVWTRFLDQNRFDSYRIATYAKIGKMDEAPEIAAAVLARLQQPDRKKAAIILEDIATAHLMRGSVQEASRVAQSGLAIRRETEFTMWLPRFEAIAHGLQRLQRQPAVRSYLEEFA